MRRKTYGGGVMLDCYNNVICEISCTITTRVSASSNIYVCVDEDEEKSSN